MTVRAILHVFVEQGKIEDVGEALARMPEVIDVYKVTGEYDLIATAKANGLHRLRSFSVELIGVENDGSSYCLYSMHLHQPFRDQGGLRVMGLSSMDSGSIIIGCPRHRDLSRIDRLSEG